MRGEELVLLLGIIAFMYLIFGMVRASARSRGRWHIKYDAMMLLLWSGSMAAHYYTHNEWAFALRCIGVALLSIGAGHIIYQLFKPQPQEAE